VQDRFWHSKPVEEFYDTVDDPDEVVNLVDAPEHAHRIDVFRALLDEHMLAVNDNGFIPDGSELEGWEASREPGAYPLPEAMALAARAIERCEAHLDDFVVALGDDSEVLRFWAAQGLLMLGPRCAPAAARLRTSLLDRSPHVRIVAAEALAQAGHQDVAEPVLVGLLDPGNDWRVRLQALNALTYLPALPSSALAAVDATLDDDQEYLRGAGRYLRLLLKGEYAPEAAIFDWEKFFARLPPALRPTGPGR
jgi:hypothetical protein